MSKGSFQVYKSSAGSGKTYTLVKEYLKIVLPQPEKMRQILAITFTNAAAAEMKSRIIEELGALASLDKNPGNRKARKLLDQIISEYHDEGVTAHAESILIENAGTILADILHNYSDFSVSTIDSFVHRIVRTFAFDLRIPVNFEIEMDTDSLLNKTVDMLISRAGSDQQLTNLLIRFMVNQADDDGDLRIETAIGKLAKTLMDEDSAPFVEKLKELSLDEFLSIQQQISGRIKAYENNAAASASQALALISQQGLGPEAFSQGRNGIVGYFQKLSQGNVPETIVPGKNARNTIDNDKWYGSKATPADKAAIDSIKPGLLKIIEDVFGISNQYFENYQLLRAVSQNLFPLGVLNEVQKVLEEIKAENVLLHISDFNRKISAIVAEQPVPFIYERIGEHYQHYMIDEFQDTSILQWQNLLPLVENGLATEKLSLVVGDGKQAIYRFRNGDVEQFVGLPQLPAGIAGINKEQWQATLERNFIPRNLGTNYRSRKVIVDFNNRFFEMAKAFLSQEMQAIYHEHTQAARQNAEGGYVEINFLGKDEEQTYDELTLEKVKETIERLQQAGHPLSDITILCRSNSKGSLLARYLLRQQVPVISSESLLLNQSEEVIFFISVLKLLVNRHDAIAAAEMINYLLTAGWLKKVGSVHQALQATSLFPAPSGAAGVDWQVCIEKLLAGEGHTFRFSAFLYLNLYDICEGITRQFFTRGTPNPFVAFFMDAVFEYAEKNSLSIADFLAWWEESGHKYSLVVPEGLNAVRIMTIHKSKGLQFPVVIFPFADLEIKKATREGLWVYADQPGLEGLRAVWLKMTGKTLEHTPYQPLYQKEMERTMLDTINLAYVAFTRPREKLFVIAKNPPDKLSERPPLQKLLEKFLHDQQTPELAPACYAFGTFEEVEGRQPAIDSSEPLFGKLLSRSWTAALRMRSNQEERGVASAGQRERGKLLHRAMEQIITKADIAPVLARMRAEGEIDQPTEQEWNERISELLRLEKLAPCFAPGVKVKAEAGLFDENGNFFRPDRVVLLDDRTVVIDYKTGGEYDSHREQIENYAKLLQTMINRPVEKLLLYLDEYKLKSV